MPLAAPQRAGRSKLSPAACWACAVQARRKQKTAAARGDALSTRRNLWRALIACRCAGSGAPTPQHLPPAAGTRSDGRPGLAAAGRSGSPRRWPARGAHAGRGRALLRCWKGGTRLPATERPAPGLRNCAALFLAGLTASSPLAWSRLPAAAALLLVHLYGCAGVQALPTLTPFPTRGILPQLPGLAPKSLPPKPEPGASLVPGLPTPIEVIAGDAEATGALLWTGRAGPGPACAPACYRLHAALRSPNRCPVRPPVARQSSPAGAWHLGLVHSSGECAGYDVYGDDALPSRPEANPNPAFRYDQAIAATQQVHPRPASGAPFACCTAAGHKHNMPLHSSRT